MSKTESLGSFFRQFKIAFGALTAGLLAVLVGVMVSRMGTSQDIRERAFQEAGRQYSGTAAVTPNENEWGVALKFGGILQQRDDLTVRVKVASISGQVVFNDEIVVVSNQQGIYTGVAVHDGALSGGPAWILVKGPYHVAKVFSVPGGIDAEQMVDLTAGELKPGDLATQDGKANLDDVDKLKALLGKSSYSESELGTGDVNLDGTINSVDLGLVLATLSTKDDEELP